LRHHFKSLSSDILENAAHKPHADVATAQRKGDRSGSTISDRTMSGISA
jgi:hypothetical protein